MRVPFVQIGDKNMDCPGRRIGVAGADQVPSGADKNEVICLRDVAAVAFAQLCIGLNDEYVDVFHDPLRTCTKEGRLHCL
jgi:hypothetical protein